MLGVGVGGSFSIGEDRHARSLNRCAGIVSCVIFAYCRERRGDKEGNKGESGRERWRKREERGGTEKATNKEEMKKPRARQR